MAQLDTGSLNLGVQTQSSYLDLAIRHTQTALFSHLVILTFITWFLARNFLPPSDGVKVPSVGRRSVLEPSILIRMRFALGALGQISEGYRKYKDGFFRLSRNDRDVIVIAPKYVDELRNLPEETLSSSLAVTANHVGKYVGILPVLESHLHFITLQTRMTPSIPRLIARMRGEVRDAFPSVIPDCQDRWVEVSIQEIMLNLISRVTSRVLLGDRDCYNEDWAEASREYAANATLTIGILRLFPSTIRPLVAWIVPPVWKVETNLNLAKKALIPIIERRREDEEKEGASYQKPDDFLQWMMDAAVGDEARPDKLAHLLVIVFLGAAHTSTMAGAHVCYDLCAMPEYIEPLRDEIQGLLSEDGGWSPTTPARMRKMDSFLRESQRQSPPSILDFHRFVQKPLTLSNGLHLPAGTQICTASYPISKDPQNISNPENFDGFRYYRQRQEPDEDNKHQFATTDKTHMHFGRGKYACPGRFFASAELKVIVAHLILEYDFKYPDGRSRPENLNADEFLYPDPNAKILIKRRSNKIAS